MFFPPNYPNVPPKVNLVTTANGQVRFNPSECDLHYSAAACNMLLRVDLGDSGTYSKLLVPVELCCLWLLSVGVTMVTGLSNMWHMAAFLLPACAQLFSVS
jgi:hypothetical protein